MCFYVTFVVVRLILLQEERKPFHLLKGDRIFKFCIPSSCFLNTDNTNQWYSGSVGDLLVFQIVIKVRTKILETIQVSKPFCRLIWGSVIYTGFSYISLFITRHDSLRGRHRETDVYQHYERCPEWRWT